VVKNAIRLDAIRAFGRAGRCQTEGLHCAKRKELIVIDDVELARALHVLFVAHWIGGVSFVTLVALPLARAASDARKGWALFESIENRFSAQVRWTIPLAGATGLWMTWRLELWARFSDPSFWWMDAMVLVWALFMIAVFVIEPFAHRRLGAEASRDPEGVMRRLFRVHLVLLAAAALTIIGAVAGSRGGLFS
jgi:uncharacterized membrane protein